MPREVEVEDFLRQVEEAPTRFSQLHQCQGVEQRQRNVLGQLEFAAVLIQVSGFEAAQVILELFARQ